MRSQLAEKVATQPGLLLKAAVSIEMGGYVPDDLERGRRHPKRNKTAA